jgi:hypothetical protein
VSHLTLVHGMCNKPPLEILLDIWERALRADGGLDLAARGVTTTMVYWCDVLYDLPLTDPAEYENTSADTGLEPVDPVSMAWEKGLDLGEKRWVGALAAKVNVAIGVDEAAQVMQSPLERNLERIPLPWPVKRRLMKTLVRDVHHYLFDCAYSPRPGRTYRVRNEIRQRMQAALAAGADRSGPHIVIAHGMGGLIAYDCLKRLRGPAVDALMTIGSPLGIDEVQECLKPGWSRDDGFPGERVRSGWVNVYDMFDPITGPDPGVASDYRRRGEAVVEDIDDPNSGLWRHNVSKYLKGAKLRARLASLLGWF